MNRLLTPQGINLLQLIARGESVISGLWTTGLDYWTGLLDWTTGLTLEL